MRKTITVCDRCQKQVETKQLRLACQRSCAEDSGVVLVDLCNLCAVTVLGQVIARHLDRTETTTAYNDFIERKNAVHS